MLALNLLELDSNKFNKQGVNMVRLLTILSVCIFLHACSLPTEEEMDQAVDKWAVNIKYQSSNKVDVPIVIKHKTLFSTYQGMSSMYGGGGVMVTTAGQKEAITGKEELQQTGEIVAQRLATLLRHQGVTNQGVEVIAEDVNVDLNNTMLISILIQHMLHSADSVSSLDIVYSVDNVQFGKTSFPHKTEGAMLGGCWWCTGSDIAIKRAHKKFIKDFDSYLQNTQTSEKKD